MHLINNVPRCWSDLFIGEMGDISIRCQFLFLFSSFFSAALLCADWKILSFISLLLPATGAGWRRTMQLRRFETKEVIWRQHLASLNKEIASTKQRSGQLHEAQLWASSQSVIGERVQAVAGFCIVLDFTYMYSLQILTDKREQEPQHVWDVIIAADNRSSKQWLFIFCELVHVFVCSQSSNCSLTDTQTHT